MSYPRSIDEYSGAEESYHHMDVVANGTIAMVLRRIANEILYSLEGSF